MANFDKMAAFLESVRKDEKKRSKWTKIAIVVGLIVLAIVLLLVIGGNSDSGAVTGRAVQAGTAWVLPRALALRGL